MRILVVDDDVATRFMVASRLDAWGYETAAAENGKQAWHMLNADHYDLVISDWNMPELNGLELCRLIRNGSNGPYRYVILCTANDQRADFIIGMDAGADDFMVKPIDAGELRARLRAAERILELQAGLAGQNRSLRKLNEQLRTAYQTIERDLAAAAAMQRRLLPERPLERNRARLDWLMVPSSFLAGDMVNYFMADERFLVFYQLDVSGHGIPAALVSVTLNQILSAEKGSPIFDSASVAGERRMVSPAEVVSELNRRFQAHDGEYFTIVYGVLDTYEGDVRFCQAGHPMPICVNLEGEITKVGNGGFPVGLWPDMEYDETSFKLLPGERLFLHSDGITDCRNPAGEPYSTERLEALLRKHRTSCLMDVGPLIQQDVTMWHGDLEFADDISLLALECMPRGAKTIGDDVV